MNNDDRKRRRAAFQISEDLLPMDAAELIREALDARLRLRQATQQLEEAFGYFQASTYQKLNEVVGLIATADGLDETVMQSILNGIQRRGEPDPKPCGRLLGF